MRKRLAMLWLPCALLLALALPGPALAAPKFGYTIEQDVCTAGAGKFGFGHGVVRVRVAEFGNSGANRFTYLARVWHRNLHGTDWSAEYAWPNYERTFPDNGESYWSSRGFSYDPKHNTYHRIVVRVRAWHNDTLLFSQAVYGAIC